MKYNTMDRSRYSSNNNQQPDSTVDSDDFLDVEYYGVRAANMPAHSTPRQMANMPSQHQTFGSQIDIDLGWMPSNFEMSDLVDSDVSRREQRRRNVTFIPSTVSRSAYFGTTSDIDSDIFEQSSLESFQGMPAQSTPRSYNLPPSHPNFGSPIRRPYSNLDQSSNIDNIFFDQSSDIIDTDDFLLFSKASRSGRSRPYHSTPNRSNIPAYETFGSPIREDASRRLPSRYMQRNIEQSSDIDSRFFEQSSNITNSRIFLPQSIMKCRCSTPNRSGTLPDHPSLGSPIIDETSQISFDPTNSPQSSPKQSLTNDSASPSSKSTDVDTNDFQSSDLTRSRNFSNGLQCRCSTPNRSAHPSFGTSVRPNVTLSRNVESQILDQSSDIADSRNFTNRMECRCSTPKRSCNLPSHPTFGSPIMQNANLSSDVDSRMFDQSSDILDSRNFSNRPQCRCSTPKRSGNLPSHSTFGSPIIPNVNLSSYVDSQIFDQSSDIVDSRNFSNRMQGRYSTPKRSGNLPNHLTFGSSIMSNINESSEVDSRIFTQSRNQSMPAHSTPMRRTGNIPPHLTFGSMNQSSGVSFDESMNPTWESIDQSINTSYFNRSLDPTISSINDRSGNTTRFNLSSIPDAVPQMMGNSPKKSKSPSLIEWFDKTVEKELQKRRNTSLNITENLVNLEAPSSPSTGEGDALAAQNVLLLDASTSRLDIEAALKNEQQTELKEAVDKLAKAEAMCIFEGAVRAAEKAAATASPEYAEEAAAAGAQGFQAEIINVVEQEIPGVKPIEVIGYVGITRPKKPKKSTFT